MPSRRPLRRVGQLAADQDGGQVGALPGHGEDLRGQVRVGEHQAAAGQPELMGQEVAAERGVDRGLDRADVGRPEQQVQVLGAVRHQGGDHVALTDAQVGERVGVRPGPGDHLLVGDRLVIDPQGDPLRSAVAHRLDHLHQRALVGMLHGQPFLSSEPAPLPARGMYFSSSRAEAGEPSSAR